MMLSHWSCLRYTFYLLASLLQFQSQYVANFFDAARMPLCPKACADDHILISLYLVYKRGLPVLNISPRV